jgi:hypothetical protein
MNMLFMRTEINPVFKEAQPLPKLTNCPVTKCAGVAAYPFAVMQPGHAGRPELAAAAPMGGQFNEVATLQQ